jgi:hypothetical protein
LNIHWELISTINMNDLWVKRMPLKPSGDPDGSLAYIYSRFSTHPDKCLEFREILGAGINVDLSGRLSGFHRIVSFQV